ncbi:MAG: hypothetical protein ALAOOOJD_01756 [bacterium]|nr:hypothetical protein [bacterium]
MANYCFVAPILPGGLEQMKKWNKEMLMHNKEHDEVFQAAGISREQVWLQHTPQGDFAVVSFEVKDPNRAFQSLATSQQPWAVKFREFLFKAHGLEMTRPVSPNELLVDWHSKTK